MNQLSNGVLRCSVPIVDPLHTVGPDSHNAGVMDASPRCAVSFMAMVVRPWGTPHALRPDRTGHSRGRTQRGAPCWCPPFQSRPGGELPTRRAGRQEFSIRGAYGGESRTRDRRTGSISGSTPHTVVNSAIQAFRSANSGFPPNGTGSGGSGYRGGARTYCLRVWLMTRIGQDRYRRP
jgi:hypothetical protein